MHRILSYLFCCILFFSCDNSHLNREQNARFLLLSKEGAKTIKENKSHPIIYEATAKLEMRLSGVLAAAVEVPQPKDPGGGYTHEKHKENYAAVKDAATMYLLSGDVAYLEYTKNVLLVTRF